jgi:hypothetical protein
MPKWVPVEATGILMRGPTGIILSLTGGGYWCLELSRCLKADKLGTRVTVTGTRVGFNDIAVDKIGPA